MSEVMAAEITNGPHLHLIIHQEEEAEGMDAGDAHLAEEDASPIILS